MNAPPPPPPAEGPAAAQDPPGTVGSLVWAIVGFNLLPVIGSIVAVVMGSRARTRAQAEGQPDPSVARAGRILGWIGLIVFGIMLVLTIVAIAIAVAVGPPQGPDQVPF